MEYISICLKIFETAVWNDFKIQIETSLFILVTCGSPPVINHAIIMDIETGSTFSSGQQLTYACDQGYEMEGDPRAMCDAEGDWTWLGIKMMCRRM